MRAEIANELAMQMRVQARPETVFAYFTDPEKFQRWQGFDARLDPRPGGVFMFRSTAHSTVRGEFVSVDPPHRLVFTWGWDGDVPLPLGIHNVAAGSTTVEVTFEPDGEATIVRVRHTGFPDAQAQGLHGWGWGMYLERLAVAATGGAPGPDPLPAMVSQFPRAQG